MIACTDWSFLGTPLGLLGLAACIWAWRKPNGREWRLKLRDPHNVEGQRAVVAERRLPGDDVPSHRDS